MTQARKKHRIFARPTIQFEDREIALKYFRRFRPDDVPLRPADVRMREVRVIFGGKRIERKARLNGWKSVRSHASTSSAAAIMLARISDISTRNREASRSSI